MATKANPFAKFALKTKKVNIEALGSEVEIRELTVAQSIDFQNQISSALKDDNSGEFDRKKLTAIITNVNLNKVATSLVEPAMTVEDLESLSDTASDAIGEIVKAIDGFEEELKK